MDFKVTAQYLTPDGQTFESESAAQRHIHACNTAELASSLSISIPAARWLATQQAIPLNRSAHSAEIQRAQEVLRQKGVWEVFSEGNEISYPKRLFTAKGTLLQVLEHALENEKFRDVGCGGMIRPHADPNIVDLSQK